MSVVCYMCENYWDLDCIKIDSKHEYCLMCHNMLNEEYKVKKPILNGDDAFKSLLNLIESLVDECKELRYRNEMMQNFIKKINK